MPENTEQESKRLENQGDSQKEHPTADRSGFGRLGESILQSLPIGIVAFDSDFRILRANAQATILIELGDYIDKSLAKGTDDKIWQGRGAQLNSAHSEGKPCKIGGVKHNTQ